MGSFGVTSHPFSHHTMKIFLFGILLVLGASVNGQDAPEPADIGLIDCDALAIVMGALKSVNKDAMEKEGEAKEKPDMAKPGMRQQETEGDEKEEDPKKT